jgi:hypothetical protein
MYCLCCQLPKHPRDHVVQLIHEKRGGGIVQGTCCDCGNAMGRIVGPAVLAAMRQLLRIISSDNSADCV